VGDPQATKEKKEKKKKKKLTPQRVNQRLLEKTDA
jgi:hypothetical protein